VSSEAVGGRTGSGRDKANPAAFPERLAKSGSILKRIRTTGCADQERAVALRVIGCVSL
jgi:hypothetical protein